MKKEYTFFIKSKELNIDALKDESIEVVRVEYLKNNFEKVSRTDLLALLNYYKILEKGEEAANFVRSYAQGCAASKVLSSIVPQVGNHVPCWAIENKKDKEEGKGL